MAILGGIGGLAGPVLGSFIITVLPELLRGFADLRLIANGVILPVRARRRDLRPDRPQRRRQDHGVQPDHRPVAAQRRLDHVQRPKRAGQEAAQHHAHGHCAHVPEHPSLQRDDVAGKRGGGRLSPHELRLPQPAAGPAGLPRARKARPRARPRAADVDASGSQGQRPGR
ncbi:hypothetical protein G6F65_019625 [Rhizopus arrhizus]|nr:hypothetical protein G6F65_019625 [Rhizopus arrhizus]